ncbi:NAD(P)/FAD-dependent oxidoreductase [Haloarcula nitratireducens]|uniref:FAD-binding oxidoreductase n=1 Tax=Haloarcula nitratireducens TaxID=2487749 RepID=A0AAW4P758_9EURY|nr:FAD-dependent oxidoreductase [Halomicroarcula nitratireducens]MBX0293458.1 FAD-binding oxidoreductase [Halomicroarcula nitratireducens]
MRVAVVGGGAVGLVAAADLAERDVDVTLYERDELGSGATGRAAGICYDAFAGELDAAVADRALARYREWDLLEPCPYVWAARERGDETAVRGQVAEMQSHGRAVERISPDELGERYPSLRTGGIEAAGIATAAGLLDPDAVVARLADRARQRGVTVETNAPVSLVGPTAVETPSGRRDFDAVVAAAGPATKPLVADAGVSLALKAFRTQALVTDPFEETLPSFYDATEEFYWRPRGDALLVGGGAHAADPTDWDAEADPAFVETALGNVRSATTLDPTPDRAWAGLCTATPDRDPLVGRVADGLWVATGWQGHGLMRAPAMGEFVAERICGTSPRIDAPLSDRFDPTRFDGEESFDPLGDPTADW